MKRSLVLFVLIAFCHFVRIEALTLKELVEISPRSPSILVYRWSSQVALIEVDPTSCEGFSLQMPLAAYYKIKRPLKNRLYAEGSRLSAHSAWKQLLSSAIEPHPNPGSWRPNLALFKRLGLQVEWKVWKITLQTPLEEAPELRYFTVYTASGPDLEKVGLPQNGPYWIENHDTVHKWAMFLMDVESNQETITSLRETP